MVNHIEKIIGLPEKNRVGRVTGTTGIFFGLMVMMNDRDDDCNDDCNDDDGRENYDANNDGIWW